MNVRKTKFIFSFQAFKVPSLFHKPKAFNKVKSENSSHVTPLLRTGRCCSLPQIFDQSERTLCLIPTDLLIACLKLFSSTWFKFFLLLKPTFVEFKFSTLKISQWLLETFGKFSFSVPFLISTQLNPVIHVFGGVNRV